MTSAATELSPDAYHDLPWTQVLPWLAHHTPATARELADLTPSPDWWLTESPAITTMAVDHEDLCRCLTRLLLVRYPEAAFKEALPTLPGWLPLSALPTGARTRTAFQRLQVQTVGELGALSIKDLYDIRGTGQGTVEDIVTTLVSTAITRAPVADEAHVASAGIPPVTEPASSLPPVQVQLLEDLTRLAAWRHVRRLSDQPLLSVVIENSAPEQIQEVALRINSLTAADIAPQASTPDPVLDFTALVSQLDERQVTILRERLMAKEPKKLADLGAELEVSRERVRQIETRIKALLARTFHFGTSIGNLLASLRAEIQPIAALDRLVALHPELDREVPGFGVPFWLVLDRLDDYFEVTEGWATAPDVATAREQTRTLLEDFATEHGLVDFATVSAATTMPATELHNWLAWCGYTLRNNQILTRTRSLNDHAAGVLAATSQPLHIDELHQRMGRGNSVRSLANALGDDERFIRTDRSTWGLASWRLEEYTSIRQQIGLELANAGGEVELDQLVRSITNRFDVSASSVHAYAGNGDYEIADGVVRRRAHRATPRKAPIATRRLFRHGEAWKLRITITRDHLRGSGFPVPSGVAKLVECPQGGVVELDSDLGTQSIRWTGLQPASGTIKRFLDQLQAVEGQIAFLEFAPHARFNVSLQLPPSPDAGPLQHALALIGAAETDDSNSAQAILAAAVDLPPDAKPRHVLSAYYRRGDDDIAALLEQIWIRPRQPVPLSEHSAAQPSNVASEDSS